MPETVGPETRKWVGHVAPGAERHYRGPVPVKCVKQFKVELWLVNWNGKIGVTPFHIGVLFRMFRREIFGSSDDIISQAAPSAAGEPPPPIWMNEEDKISHLVDLTQKTFLVVERELKLTGFWESIPARNKLKADLQTILLAEEFDKLPNLIKNRAHIISRIVEIAEKNNDTILYAE